MVRWIYGLGGLIAWAAHFIALYAIASIEAQTPADDRLLWQWVAGGVSLACAGGCAILLAVAAPRLRRQGEAVSMLMDQFAALGAGVGLVAIAWQTASALIV